MSQQAVGEVFPWVYTNRGTCYPHAVAWTLSNDIIPQNRRFVKRILQFSGCEFHKFLAEKSLSIGISPTSGKNESIDGFYTGEKR